MSFNRISAILLIFIFLVLSLNFVSASDNSTGVFLEETDEHPIENIEIDDIDIDNIGFEDDENYEINPEDFDPTMFESKKSRRLNEEGTKLNVFGKHPGYRKKPMTLPQTGNDKEGNYEDWNDNSVYSEEPFGNKIGSSAPYDKLISDSVKAVLESLKKKH